MRASTCERKRVRSRSSHSSVAKKLSAIALSYASPCLFLAKAFLLASLRVDSFGFPRPLERLDEIAELIFDGAVLVSVHESLLPRTGRARRHDRETSSTL